MGSPRQPVDSSTLDNLMLSVRELRRSRLTSARPEAASCATRSSHTGRSRDGTSPCRPPPSAPGSTFSARGCAGWRARGRAAASGRPRRTRAVGAVPASSVARPWTSARRRRHAEIGLFVVERLGDDRRPRSKSSPPARSRRRTTRTTGLASRSSCDISMNCAAAKKSCTVARRRRSTGGPPAIARARRRRTRSAPSIALPLALSSVQLERQRASAGR